MRSKRAKRGSNKDVGDGGDADECPLVSLAHQVMTPIAAHLSGDDLSALARTSVTMRHLCDGPQGRLWWRDACVALLGKTHCAVHLRAWGGPTGGHDTAKLWRELYRDASFPVSFSWHADLGGSLWEGVHDKDFGARQAAMRRAEDTLGPFPELDELEEWGDIRFPEERQGSERARRAIAERGPLAVAPQLAPDLARSGHTSTLIDELGLMVVVGGMMLVAMDGDDAAPEGAPDFNGGKEGDVKVHAVRLPEMEVVAPDVMNWKSASASEENHDMDPMSSKDPIDTPVNRFRHQTIDARLPLGSRMSREAFGDDGGGWGSDGTDYSKGATLLVHGGYDGVRRCFNDVFLLRITRDGSRCLWGHPGKPIFRDMLGHMLGAGPPVFHHTLTRLRDSPRAISIGGQTNDSMHNQVNQLLLGDGAVLEMDLDKWIITYRGTSGWPVDTVGEMDEILNSRWLHIAALRPPREERVFAPAWLQWNQNIRWNEHKNVGNTPADRTNVRKHKRYVGDELDGGPNEAVGEEIVILGGYDDGPDSEIGTMEPWVLDVDQWRWRRCSAHPEYLPFGRHRAGYCIIGRNFLLVHGGMGVEGMLEEYDSSVLDLTTLTWIDPDIGIHQTESGLSFEDAWQSVRLRQVAGHTLEGMVAFGGCQLGFGPFRHPTPISKMDVLILGRTPGVAGGVTPGNKMYYFAELPIGESQRDSWMNLCSTTREKMSPYTCGGHHRIVVYGRERRVQVMEYRDGSKAGLVAVRPMGHSAMAEHRDSTQWYDSDYSDEDSDSEDEDSDSEDEDSGSEEPTDGIRYSADGVPLNY